MKITSNDFGPGGEIPSRFTCDSKESKLPNLLVSEIPENCECLVLIVSDPDAPSGEFTHFVLFNIPIVEVVNIEEIVENSLRGKTTKGELDYVPPCPPQGSHRYFFKIFALDKMLDLAEGSSREEVESEMQANIIDQAELMGTYSRN